MKKVLFLLLPLILLVATIQASAETHTVAMNNLSFVPQSLTIDQGDTVEWSNIDARMFGGIAHTTTNGTNCSPDNAGWDSGPLSLGDTFSVTFNVPGEYDYFCSFHCQSTNMVGTIIVNPVTLPSPTTTELFDYAPVASPVISVDPLQSMPLGVGSFAHGGADISIRIQLPSFQEPTDLYFGISYNGVLSLLTPGGFQAFEDAGLTPWMTGVTDFLDLAPFDSIPVSSIPPGLFTLYLAAAPTVPPAGTLPLYIWATTVVIP